MDKVAELLAMGVTGPAEKGLLLYGGKEFGSKISAGKEDQSSQENMSSVNNLSSQSMRILSFKKSGIRGGLTEGILRGKNMYDP